MSKYYEIHLNEKCVGNYYSNYHIICKKTLINIFFYPVFREIITGKLIYPNNVSRRQLTYVMCKYKDSNYNEHKGPMCIERTSTKVEKWLNNMDEESLREYIDHINEIEKASIKYYDEHHQKKLEVKGQERVASTSIRKTLRKIRTR